MSILKYVEMSNHYAVLQEHNVMGLLYFKTKQILRKRDQIFGTRGGYGEGKLDAVNR